MSASYGSGRRPRLTRKKVLVWVTAFILGLIIIPAVLTPFGGMVVDVIADAFFMVVWVGATIWRIRNARKGYGWMASIVKAKARQRGIESPQDVLGVASQTYTEHKRRWGR